MPIPPEMLRALKAKVRSLMGELEAALGPVTSWSQQDHAAILAELRELIEPSALRYPLARDRHGLPVTVDARASDWLVSRVRGRIGDIVVKVPIGATPRQLADALAAAGYEVAGDFELIPFDGSRQAPLGFPAFCRLVQAEDGAVFAIDP